MDSHEEESKKLEEENKKLKLLMEKIFKETNSEFYEFDDGNDHAVRIGNIQIPLEQDEFTLIVDSVLHVDLNNTEVVEEDYSYLVEKPKLIN